ncbi:MAG: ATP-binding protein [Spirochaetota bacterium]
MKQLRIIRIIIVAIWIIAILLISCMRINDNYSYKSQLENIVAQIAHDKDTTFRRWIAKQGGVYVPVSEHTKPNPFLKVQNRDITTDKGEKLTLMNPAYVMRQALDLSYKEYNLKGRLISLRPFNPMNTPDSFEKQALIAFEKGETMVSSNETIDNIEYLRYVKPFKADATCLKCHGHQNYKIGDIMGGISVSVPSANLNKLIKNEIINIVLIHSITLIIGIVLILFLLKILSKQWKARIKAEEDLIKSEKKFRTYIENAPDGILVTDLNNYIIDVNPAACKLLGYTRDELITTHKNRLVSQEYRDKIKASLDIIQQAEKHSAEAGFIKKNGTTFIGLLDASRLNDTTAIGFIKDITPIKLIEQTLRENEEELIALNKNKDRFLSILAHDLRQPFNSILGFSDFLLENFDELDKAEIIKQIKIINQVSHNTYHLLEDLLLWSKALTDKVIIDKQKIDLSKLVNDLIGKINIYMNKKDLSINYFETEKIEVFADVNMLKTVLRNLISNAIKFTNHNGQIGIYAESGQSGTIITVSDNGVGIDKNKISRLWDFTDEIIAVGTDGEKGSGFGLSLCKELLERHGGQIWVESELGKGSDFKFTIPD